MKTRTIHHFEDQTEGVRWIASALLNRFWLKHAEWIIDDGQFKESDRPKSTSFHLKVGEEREDYEITHRLYETPEEFEEAEPTLSHGDIVLLDLWTGGREYPGLALYDLAVQRLGEERVFVLTALPQPAIVHGVPKDHVFVKPVDPTTLINAIVNAFGLGDGQ